MGLFGPGMSFSRMGEGPPAIAARKAIEDIALRLENELHDTPSEYFALQAGGMYFASETRTMNGVRPVQSLDDSFVRTTQIMREFIDKPSAEKKVLTGKAREVYNLLCAVVFEEKSQPALLVGHLNDYLSYLEGSHLRRRREPPLPHIQPLKVPWALICILSILFTIAILLKYLFFS